jgi:hypothetical protein
VHRHIREAFARAGVRCHITFTLNQSYAAYALVEAGNGLGLFDPLIQSVAFPERPVLTQATITPEDTMTGGKPAVLGQKPAAMVE